MNNYAAFPHETLMEQDLCGIYRTTPAGDILFCNQYFAYMLGYNSAAELISKNCLDLYFSGETRKAFIEHLRIEKKLHNYQAILKKKDGTTLHTLENVAIVEDKATGACYLDGVIIDISGQVEALAALKKSESQFREIVETAQEGIWMLDRYDKTTFVNPKICEMLGYTAPEMMGKRLYDFMDAEGEAYARDCMKRRRAGAKENLDIRYVTKAGKDIWCNISTTPMFTETGAYNGALAMVTDITDRIQVAEEKEQLIADLSERNKGLGQFTYIVSHNLRAPVANILGLVTLLKDAQAANAGKLLQGIQDSALVLDHIISDLHEILRVKSGGFQQKEYVPFGELVKTISASINLLIDEQKVIIREDFSAVEGAFTVRSYLHSIFYNLIVNSIKYARPDVLPVITIRSIRKDRHIALVFQDNGKGIDLQRFGNDLFGLYKRFDISTEGKGMGLFMVKAQAESLGGSITVESEVGQGTTFTVLLNTSQ